ncbi:MAG: peptidase T [Oscillospiraceae bacterium]
MRAYERFMGYVQVGTASDPENADVRPSTARQFDLARRLVEEMHALGIADARVDAHCYVYGSIAATPGCEGAPALGLIAHLDTSPDACGAGVRPLLHPNYDGADVRLPDGSVISAERFPALKKLRGQTLITASGGTLLGADDKAGIAEIMTACEQVLCGAVPHGKLCIAFTPDEEIGRGPEGFDVAGFGAQFAYTVDGGAVEEIEYENFNAATAQLHFTGVEVHPGEAKGIMVNATQLAMAYDGLLPKRERPEYTEGREGFFHLVRMEGTVGKARSAYLIRDHDRAGFEARKERMRQAAAELQAYYGAGCVHLEMEDSYYNMREVIEQHFHLVENAEAALRTMGLEPVVAPIRGGTDGSQLSFMGLPCPNLGTGGRYAHGPNECVTAEEMDRVVELLLGIIGRYAKKL